MLCVGLIYGDFLEYNVLVGLDGLVIIDLLQVVSVVGNNNVCFMLCCDVSNFIIILVCFVLELLDIYYVEEMWVLFEQSELYLDIEFIGYFIFDECVVDVDSVMQLIIDVCEEVIICQQGCEVVCED